MSDPKAVEVAPGLFKATESHSVFSKDTPAIVRGVETPEEKAERERLEMLEEALRMNF